MATGLDDLERALTRFVDQLEAELSQAVDDEARAIWLDELTWVPVLSGELFLGIEIRVDGPMHRTVGIFDPLLHWAVWIEWGRKNAPAQPFATPAAEAARARWPRRVEDVVRRVARAQQ